MCTVCEAIVGFVESYLEQNATVAQIEARLEAACALTGPFATECKALVDAYLPQIIAWVEKNETPADICTKLGVCNDDKKAVARVAVEHVAGPQDGMCTVCQAIVGFVESYLEQNSTEAQIQARLDAACALTGPFATECKALVDQYLPQIISWVEKNETPADICTQLGVCNDRLRKAVTSNKSGTGCMICKTVVGYVEIYLAQNATEVMFNREFSCFVFVSFVKL